MTNCTLDYFIAHIVRTAKMEPKHLAFEARGYNEILKSKVFWSFVLVLFCLGGSLEQGFIKSQGYRISTLQIYPFVLAESSTFKTNQQTAVRCTVDEQGMGFFQRFYRTEGRRECLLRTLKASG